MHRSNRHLSNTPVCQQNAFQKPPTQPTHPRACTGRRDSEVSLPPRGTAPGLLASESLLVASWAALATSTPQNKPASTRRLPYPRLSPPTPHQQPCTGECCKQHHAQQTRKSRQGARMVKGWVHHQKPTNSSHLPAQPQCAARSLAAPGQTGTAQTAW